MSMIFDYSPLFDEIDAAFHVGSKTVIFAWGTDIYNPQRVRVTSELLAHEEIHGRRQGSDIVGWWHRYIEDSGFRLAEEIEAHKAEYMWLITHRKHGNEVQRNRNYRRYAASAVGAKLASPLYGKMISLRKAKKILTAQH